MSHTAFDPALLGGQYWLERGDGSTHALPTSTWCAAEAPGDRQLLDRCHGPTLDAGCGPGRLTAALLERQLPALGVDTSQVAIELTRRRGAPALQRSIFDRLPGEGRWHHVLLTDGNIGIGGDPRTLLARVHELLAPAGSAIVEAPSSADPLESGPARVVGSSGASEWFPWARIGSERIGLLAATVGLQTCWQHRHGQRWFLELQRS